MQNLRFLLIYYGLVYALPGISDLVTLVSGVKKWKKVKNYRQRLMTKCITASFDKA